MIKPVGPGNFDFDPKRRSTRWPDRQPADPDSKAAFADALTRAQRKLDETHEEAPKTGAFPPARPL